MKAMKALSEGFKRLLPVIEKDLTKVLEAPPNSPPLFYRMIHYHMGWCDEDGNPTEGASGGKRIRPMLTLLVSEAVGGEHEAARAPSAAVELIHNFSLLHDDIQDKSPLRRNRPTVWCAWNEAQAINAGDVLFTLAHLAIPRLALAGSPHVAQMLEILGETSLELTRGQHLDMLFETKEHVSTDEYLNMVEGKTAALLSTSSHYGALAAGADEDMQTHYRAFGKNLGMAFQVLDDVLDIWGDPEKTGKQAAVDIHQRKKSLPVLYGLERNKELSVIYNSDAEFDLEMVQHIIKLLDGEGARQYAEDLAKQYTDETIAHLDAVEPQGEAGEALYELVEYLLHRNS